MLDTLIRHLDMVRLSVGAFALVALMTGCTGLIDGNGDKGLTPEQKAAQQAWIDKAAPVMKTNCTSCHAAQLNINFLAGADDLAMRDSLLNFDPQVVNLDAPSSSRLLTKGAHAGPALQPSDASAVLEWIQAEKDAAGVTDPGAPVLATSAFTPLMCATTSSMPGAPDCPWNHVDLTSLGLMGASIDFIAFPLGPTDLYVNNLKITAGADGAYIEHPLFVSLPPMASEPVPDSLDRFFNVKLNVMASTSNGFGGGTAAFVGFVPNNPLQIHFKVVDKYMAPGTGSGSGGTGGGTDTGGCKKLTEFKANAQTPLKNSCASCHANGANGNAVSAMDITGIDTTDDTKILNACNQVRTRINFQTVDQSGFFIAPDPNSATNHPFKFQAGQFQPFHDSVVVWVNAEKTAQ